VAALDDVLEGAGRPGHFDGVASVVAKLFAVTGDCRAYFGEKDYQQLLVVTQMARDLGFGVEIVACPIVRDEDGLALSSRNGRLSPEGRGRALSLRRAIADLQGSTALTAVDARNRARSVLMEGGVDVAYVEVVDPATLRPLDDTDAGPARVLIAGIVDGVRLLDNGDVTVIARGEG
jgi:pantoate--beta-alanine ligase